MSQENELQKIMKQNKTRKRIMRMAKKHDVSYEIAKGMFESTLVEMLQDKEYWSKFQVKAS